MLDAAVICRPDCRQVFTSTLPRRSPSTWQASLTPASGIACAPPATTTKSPPRSRAGSHIGDRPFLAATFLADLFDDDVDGVRSEEYTSELHSLMRISNTVSCLKTI